MINSTVQERKAESQFYMSFPNVVMSQ